MKKIISLVVLFQLIVMVSCDDEPIGGIAINTDYVEVDSDLFNLITDIAGGEITENPIECIDFNYAFTIFIFNNQQELIEMKSVGDDGEFSELLGGLQAGQSISFNFPISVTLSTGELLEITDTSELKLHIDTCREELILGECNGILSDEECVWPVTDPNDPENPYNNSIFNLADDGSIVYYTEDEIYFGTWVTYIIDGQLYLNLFLNDENEVGTTWNRDWKIDSFNDTFMTLIEGTQTFEISSDCDLQCTPPGLFTACALENNPDLAEFVLRDYIICPDIGVGINNGDSLQYTFYETIEDAEAGINPISPTSYFNIQNPQTIYLRVTDLLTGEIRIIFEFEIQPIPC